jgi:hypothetical protein
MMVGHLFTFGRLLSLEEVIGRIEAVDTDAVRRYAARVCEAGDPAMAAVGPIRRLESRDVFAKRFGRAKATAGAA